MSNQIEDAGLPDFTLPVSIMAQAIASLKVDIVSQSIAYLRVDIASQSITELNVRIASSGVTLNVNITGIESGVTLNVNIVDVASTVTLNVNITNVLVNINISAQTIGLKFEDVWSAEQLYSQYRTDICYAPANNSCMIQIYFPSGINVGYIREIILTPLTKQTPSLFTIYLYDTTTGNYIVLFRIFSTEGRVIELSPPTRITSQFIVIIFCLNYSSSAEYYSATVMLWEKES